MGKQVTLEYGDGHVEVTVPDDAFVLESSQVVEPPAMDDPVGATRAALESPLGMPPLRELVGPGSTVMIAFPDRVKGGSHETAHRRVSISLLLDHLAEAGVRDEDISLVCATGLHRMNTREEITSYLGEELMTRIGDSRLFNHDAEDPDGIVDLGATPHGDIVQVNRKVIDSDLAIMIGHSQGNPYGGFSGGYKMPTTGLTTWESIRCHHTPKTMYRDDFVPASHHSHFRDQLRDIGQAIEAAMKRPFFELDAVIDSSARQLAVYAGSIPEVEKACWPIAAQRTDVEVGPAAELLVIGMPRTFHYGPGMGSNPILMSQAVGAAITRMKDALVENPTVICTSICDGWFNDEWFPSYREIFELYRNHDHPSEMVQYEDAVSTRPEYIERFRCHNAYHPFHGFSMLYMGGIAMSMAKDILIVGAEAPEFAVAMGFQPVDSFDEAMAGVAQSLGRDPRVLVIPALTASQFHARASA